jgi:hypothetical protein
MTVIECRRSNARKHPSSCACRGTGWIEICEACEGTGYNGKMQKVCGPCGGEGARMAVNPNRPLQVEKDKKQ